MKKIFNKGKITPPLLPKIVRAMKITMLLVVLGIVNVLASNSYSQKATISLKMNDASLETVLDEIENQSEFYFLFNQKLIDVNRKVRINAKNQKIDKILEDLFVGTNVHYVVFDRQIVLTTTDIKDVTKELDLVYSNTDRQSYNVKSQNRIIHKQEKLITGKVTSSEDGSGLPGVTIVIKGTLQGTVTDSEGNYKLDVLDENAILVFSSVGFVTKEVQVGNRSVIDVTLAPDITQLGEVVVTAFGIKKEKKDITYAVQNVDTKPMTMARPVNVMEGLSGKVAGMSVTRGSNGVGSGVNVILRGYRSIAGSSQPLYVVDGAIMGGSISNLSPDDIESITVLKGANAAALYGSRASNGVVVVTTKLGSKRKGFAVSLNTSYMASSPIILTDYQNEYGQGNNGIYNEHAYQSWGPKMDGSQKAHWSNDPNWPEATTDYTAQPNNVNDFFQTGRNAAVNLGISTSSENSNAYFSYTFTDAADVVPNNKMNRHDINIRYQATVIDHLTLDTKLNYIRTNTDNRVSSGYNYASPLLGIFRVPRNIKTADMEHYKFIDNEGQVRQNYWTPNNSDSGNPYWTVNMLNNNNLSERLIGLISLKYDITDNLNLLIRTSLDRNNSSYYFKWSNDTYIYADNGRYYRSEGHGGEWNSDFLLNYNNQFGSDWTIDVSLGGNIRKNEYTSISVNPDQKSQLNVPNLFSIANTSYVSAGEGYGKKQVNSLYGFATIAWKNAIILDITGRNDWSSTLPKENLSYFYPSVGLAVIVSELLNTKPGWLSLLKLRGSYAEVGNDTAPYQLERLAYVNPGGTSGLLSLSPTLPAMNLRPETTISQEYGLNMMFFKNRLGLDATYYITNSTDQLFNVSVPVGSGASNVFINAGDIQNKGIELVLNATVIDNPKFRWNMTFNYGSNRNTVVKTAPGYESLPLQSFGFIGTSKLVNGRPWGEIYSRGFARDDQGRVIVEKDGTPRTTPGLDTRVANYNPDWLGGWNNSFSFGNFDLNFLIDIRQGGTITSSGNSVLNLYGVTAATLQGRDGTLIFGENIYSNETAVQEDGSPNTVQVDAETFWNKVGSAHTPIGEAFVSDASNIRLRELVFGYSLPQSVLDGTVLSGVRFAFVGRNLFFFTNASDFDPEIINMIGSRKMEGSSSFTHPTLREYGLNIKIDF